MPAAHRAGDSRSCGAGTIVTGQGSVFSEKKLWAVNGDANSHGGGALTSAKGLAATVFAEKKPVIVLGDGASGDSALHANPSAANGSPATLAYGGEAGGGNGGGGEPLPPLPGGGVELREDAAREQREDVALELREESAAESGGGTNVIIDFVANLATSAPTLTSAVLGFLAPGSGLEQREDSATELREDSSTELREG
jgi:hypothetical protein